METRANFALIGAFVIVATVAVVSFVLWLGSSQFNREFKRYDIVFPGPVVLEKGAGVRYIGITVGEVESVQIDPEDPSMVRARIRVDRTTPVKTDSVAIIDFAGITGLTFVQITAGSEAAPPLMSRQNSEIPEIKAGPTPLAALFDGGAEIVGKASVAIDRLSLVLTQENIDAFSETLGNIRDISASLSAQDDALLGQSLSMLASLERAGDGLSEASQSVADTAKQLQTDLASLQTDLAELIAELSLTSEEARGALGVGEETLVAIQSLIEGPGIEVLQETGLTVQELQALIRRLDQVTRDLETNPRGFFLGDALPYED
jgi:phospholipid/cholesterol/gamma-HCH transport system substrate-binding protein